jgi:nucleoside-diphosphate-sugar epimerase
MEQLNTSQHLNEIYVVAGATGRSGRYIVKHLLLKNRKVRVLVRSEKKLREIFKEEDLKKLDKIVECNLVHDESYKIKLDELFKVEEDSHAKVQYVISALSYRFEKDQSCEEGNLLTNKRLIDASAQYQVKKFLLLSSSHVTRPFSFISLRCNIIKRYMQHFKVLVEDYLRKSKLNYLIIRQLPDSASNCFHPMPRR